MKTINAQNLEELGKLYLKHSEQKKKLFGGEKLKLNENEFWFELVSIDWFKKLFNLSIDVTIEDFRYWDSEEEYGFSFNNKLAIGAISEEIAMRTAGMKVHSQKATEILQPNKLTLEDIEDLVVNPPNFKSMIAYYLKKLQKTEGIKFSSFVAEKKKAEREEAARKKKAAKEEAREEAAEKRRQRDEEKRLKQKAAESAFKERIIEKHGEEIWKSYKKKKLCFDMPIELVRLMKGKEGQKKQSASKGSGTKTQLFYGKKTSKRGTVSYTLRIDFENGLCSGWTDL